MTNITAGTTSPSSPESEAPGETLASTVYHRLRGDILNGQLKPGHKLRLQALTNDYQVGNSPLREALNRLLSNGMVVREENKGFRVSPASTSELKDLIRTRCWLEEIALRESIKNATEEYDEKIVLAFHRLSRIKPNEDGTYLSDEQEKRHFEFHQSLLAACDSNILLAFCAQLHEQTLRYRNLAKVVEYREGHENTEHKEIQEAVLDRNADKAVELLRSHYNITAEIVIADGQLE